MSVNVVVKKKIRIDRKDDAILDEVPAEKPDASAADLSPSLRGLVESALSSAKNAQIPEVNPIEPLPVRPVVSSRTIAITTGIIVLLALIARFAF